MIASDLMMVDNAAVRERLEAKDLGQREFIKVPIGGGYGKRDIC